MIFYVRNESKIRLFNFKGKVKNACIAAKNKQAAFLAAEKWAGCIFGCGQTGRMHFGHQKNRQGAAAF